MPELRTALMVYFHQKKCVKALINLMLTDTVKHVYKGYLSFDDCVNLLYYTVGGFENLHNARVTCLHLLSNNSCFVYSAELDKYRLGDKSYVNP